MDQDRPLPSPCISICALNDDDVCIGCYRSADEIMRWGKLEESEKREVYANIKRRTTEADAWLGKNK